MDFPKSIPPTKSSKEIQGVEERWRIEQEVG